MGKIMLNIAYIVSFLLLNRLHTFLVLLYTKNVDFVCNIAAVLSPPSVILDGVQTSVGHRSC
jgi:hypothetical protein